jgi:hypothetical protein
MTIIEELKKLQAKLAETDAKMVATETKLTDGEKLTQAAVVAADLAAFTEELNSANRVPEVAAKHYQEAKSGQAAWRKAHPELLLKNSSAAEDLVLKGVTAAGVPITPLDSRKKLQTDMVVAREKRLQEA